MHGSATRELSESLEWRKLVNVLRGGDQSYPMTVAFLRYIVGILLQQRRRNEHFNGRKVAENSVLQMAEIRIEAAHVIHSEVSGINDADIVFDCRKVAQVRLEFLQWELFLGADDKAAHFVPFKVARVAYAQNHAVLHSWTA